MSDGILSNLLSIPAFLFFQGTWLIHSLRRPLILVSALCILSNPRAAIRKLKLFYLTFLYLAFCKDKKWKIPKDTSFFFPKELGGTSTTSSSSGSTAKYKEKTVILIRHGESTWNDTFNAGDRSKLIFFLFFIPNLLHALAVETYFFISGKDDESWFFDSALSAKGVGQGEGLRKFLRKEKMRLGSSSSGNGNAREEHAVKLLLALDEEDDPSSQVVSSNLRRAISTAAIGLADRFVATNTSIQQQHGANINNKDGILLLPCMQEISKNPDALTILPPKGVAHPTWCDDVIVGLPPGTFTSLIDTRYHTGNKSIDSNGLIRLNQFCADIFDSSKLPKSNIIFAGHSLFFRSFFQVYLPRGMEHVSKKKKLVNGGTVMVTLREATLGNGRKEYMIDPKSVVMVYGGFGKHTKG